jgi:glycosyltransferase involved in cell wall biosynthesis
MLTLGAELSARYRVSFICPPSSASTALLDRARQMGLQTLAISVGRQGEGFQTLREWLRTHEIEIFHGHAGIGWEGHPGIYAARAAAVPVVVRTEHLPYLISAAWQRAEHNRLVEAIDGLICVSEAAHSTFLQRGLRADRLCVIRNGIQPRPARPDRPGVRASLGLEPESRIVLTVARMTRQKGHRFLADAAPTVIRHHPEVHFVWVGRGPLQRKLRDQVDRLGLSGRVHFVGERHDVPDLLAASDLFVLPSQFEGLPLSLLEAMAAELPVVATRVCGTAEVVCSGCSGRLVQSEDPSDLAAGILEALEHPELAASWGRAGRLRVEQEFSSARMASETAGLYDKLRERAAAASLERLDTRPACA